MLALARCADQKALAQVFACLETEGLLTEVVSTQLLTADSLSKNQVPELNFLLATLLQSTDSLNYRLLKFYEANREHLDPFVALKSSSGEARAQSLQTVFRLLDSQPFLRKLWDASSLFDLEGGGLLLTHLKAMVHPSSSSGLRDEALSEEHLKEMLWIDREVRISKKEQARLVQSINQELGETELDLIRHQDQGPESQAQDGLVRTSYLSKLEEAAIRQIESSVFQHIAIRGDDGSGKMSLVNLLKSRCDKDQKLIVVTLEETFDSKNLVGTYVCNEVGEFEFKKGPLTVAAEQGMWLVLRNVDKAPPDLLSFLLPLVQEDVLHVTSAFSITPQLGFRLIALCSSSQ